MSTPRDARIVILGISDNPDRYAFKAARALLAKGYRDVVGVGPKKRGPEGVALAGTLGELDGPPVDTLTMYVGAATSDGLVDAVLALAPRRIVFNPGAENPRLAEAAARAGTEVVEACTLVMLATGEF